MAVFYILAIMCMRVLQSLYSKKAALVLPSGLKPYISYVALSKLFAALFAFVVMIPTLSFDGINAETIIIASFSGTFLAIGSLCGIKSLIGGTIALNSVFSTAGMIIPIILGIFFFNEPVSPIQWLCIAVLFAAILMLVDSVKNTFKGFSFKTLIYLVGSFISNGMVMFCQKLFGTRNPDGNVSMFSMLTFLVPTLTICIVLLVLNAAKVEPDKSAKLPKKPVFYSVILAFAVFVIQQFVTILTPVLSSAVLFTFVNGGATVIAAIVGATVYKEKITAKSAVAIILALAALICIKVFE